MRHTHLRAMIEHLRPEDTVKLVSTRVFTNHISKIRKMSHWNNLLFVFDQQVNLYDCITGKGYNSKMLSFGKYYDLWC